MKLKSIDLLDKKIESIIDFRVKSYYSDWKKYDRLKYMVKKGSEDKQEKKLILIARTAGTYLFSEKELENYNFAFTCLDYYFNQERYSSWFYYIDIDSLEFKKLTDNEVAKMIKDYSIFWNRKAV